jgi:hypothetical protein
VGSGFEITSLNLELVLPLLSLAQNIPLLALQLLLNGFWNRKKVRNSYDSEYQPNYT